MVNILFITGLWKNGFKNLENKWIGFCQYRKFWSSEKDKYQHFRKLKTSYFKRCITKYSHYESILESQCLLIN